MLLVWSVILALRGLGLSDSLVWPLALIGAGAALATGSATLGLDRRRARLTAIVLTGAGILTFVGGNRHGSATTLLAPGAVAAALLLLLGPWAWRLARERDAERAERIRTQERADFAARVHDSVLQTLALIQRDPGDPRRVATLARRQERELRTWLYPDREPAPAAPWRTPSRPPPPRSRSCTGFASRSFARATRRSTTARACSCSQPARR